MSIRKYHRRNKNQFAVYLPQDQIKKLNWVEHDRLSVSIEGRNIIVTKDNVLPTTLKRNGQSMFITIPIDPPKDAAPIVRVKLVGQSIVIKFL